MTAHRVTHGPSFLECFAVVLSGPLGLLAVAAGVSGAGLLMGIGGTLLVMWSLYMWHKAIAGYYS